MQQTLLKNIIGDGYCVFKLVGGGNGEFQGLLWNGNKHPAYGVEVAITNAMDLKKCKTEREDSLFVLDQICYSSITQIIHEPEVQVGNFRFINYLVKGKGDFLTLEIKYMSRSSRILQQSVIKLQNGLCPQAYRIYDISTERENHFCRGEK